MKSIYKPLLGSEVQVVSAANKQIIGLEGTVIYEKKVKEGYYIVLQTPEKVIKIEKFLLKIKDKNILIHSEYRNSKKILKSEFTLYSV